MAKTITRLFQGLFGGTDLSTSRVAQFGSLKAGTPAFASSASQIQTTQFGEGWVEAVIGQNYPAIEDRNALDYLLFYQLCYLFQQGVPEYDATTTYYANSIVSYNGVLYVCFNDSSGAGISGQTPTNSTYWDLALQTYKNQILNGGFDWWQRGIAPFVVAGTFGANAFTYTADRWACMNSMAASGASALTVSQTSGAVAGSIYGLECKVTTAPASPASGPQMFHILDVPQSMNFSGRNATFSVWVKAVGNINKVTIGLVYCSTDLSVAGNLNPIGVTQQFTINSSGFTQCVLSPQAIGSTLGTTGVLGVQILASGASTGNPSDLNNGMILEQAQLYPGAVIPAWERPEPGTELEALCRYYETSVTINGGSGSTATSSGWQGDATSGHVYNSPICRYRASKRSSSAIPVLTDLGGALNFPSTPNVNTHDQQGYSSSRTANGTGSGEYYESFTCDAEIY